MYFKEQNTFIYPKFLIANRTTQRLKRKSIHINLHLPAFDCANSSFRSASLASNLFLSSSDSFFANRMSRSNTETLEFDSSKLRFSSLYIAFRSSNCFSTLSMIVCCASSHARSRSAACSSIARSCAILHETSSEFARSNSLLSRSTSIPNLSELFLDDTSLDSDSARFAEIAERHSSFSFTSSWSLLAFSLCSDGHEKRHLEMITQNKYP
jgi:hypothetical protein